jgi:thiamine-monophosphate kinase
MRLGDWDEKSFIQNIVAKYASTARKGDFDDAVIMESHDAEEGSDKPLKVYSLDHPSFVRSPDPAIHPYRFYGRWVAGVTCNDVIAMGARCRGFSLDLAAPLDLETACVEELFQGISDVLLECGARYQGGNIDCGPLGTVGMAWGEVPAHGIVRRSGARPGDLIVVTGELGLGWLEYQLRKHGLLDHVSAPDVERLRQYKAMPVGAAGAIAAVADRGLFTSGMDLSDGLVEFLYTIVGRSDCGCMIDAKSLPVSGTTRTNLKLLLPVLPDEPGVLEQYPELMAFEPGFDSPLRHGFTVAAQDAAEAASICAAYGAALCVIGRVTEQQRVLVDLGDGRTAEIPPFWDDQFRLQDRLTAWTGFLKAFR